MLKTLKIRKYSRLKCIFYRFLEFSYLLISYCVNSLKLPVVTMSHVLSIGDSSENVSFLADIFETRNDDGFGGIHKLLKSSSLRSKNPEKPPKNLQKPPQKKAEKPKQSI